LPSCPADLLLYHQTALPPGQNAVGRSVTRVFSTMLPVLQLHVVSTTAATIAEGMQASKSTHQIRHKHNPRYYTVHSATALVRLWIPSLNTLSSEGQACQPYPNRCHYHSFHHCSYTTNEERERRRNAQHDLQHQCYTQVTLLLQRNKMLQPHSRAGRPHVNRLRYQKDRFVHITPHLPRRPVQPTLAPC
jgi:hypothetical protein